MPPSGDFRAKNEVSLLEITELMVRQCAPPEILRLLCCYAGQSDDGCEAAFFLPEGPRWTLAAKGDLSHQSEAALAAIDPSQLSDAIFETGLNAEGPPDYRFAGGWARHLYSGAGELLGMLAGFRDAPLLPSGFEANGLNLVSLLATLAIEQANLARELAFKATGNTTPDVPDLTGHHETSEQEVMRMIMQQCAPEEILEKLCIRLGPLEIERQVVFFLIRGGSWTLAAKGALTPQAEAALSRIDPEVLSQAILECDSGQADQRETPFEGGWARHLYSGTGELLGLMVGLRGVPARPRGAYAARIESASSLAAMAVEQTNLIGELMFNADHDAMTGLPSRAYYERKLHAALRESSRTNCPVALLYIDLDRFRVVNEVFGLAIGNCLLEHLGSRLHTSLRQGTMLARMGGDEFAVLVPGVTATAVAAGVAARLLDSLSTPFSIDDHEIFMNVSIGIACSTPESTPDSLEREAYLAMHEAKRAGKGRAVHFDSSLAAISPERLEMEKRLRSALSRREFVLYYQPQIEFSTGRVSGVEALLRWRQDGLGLVSPAAFIPILEDTGMIVEVGRWVMLEGCRQAKEWLDTAGLTLRIAVNVSAIQLLDPEFIGQVEEALAETGCPAELLELELTESVLVGEFDSAARILEKLQAMGIGLSLDDFGTGQSSLSYLHRLPFHRLKVDQSFIRGIQDGEQCPPLVHNILQMAESLGMGAVAEGVETAHQAEILRRERCEQGQGFFFSRPLPLAEATDFCRKYGCPAGVLTEPDEINGRRRCG